MQHLLVVVYWHFGTACHSHFQGSSSQRIYFGTGESIEDGTNKLAKQQSTTSCQHCLKTRKSKDLNFLGTLQWKPEILGASVCLERQGIMRTSVKVASSQV